MKTLIVEDDFTSRLFLQEVLKEFGEIHLAVNGQEGLTAFQEALNQGKPYNLICLDIMMPEMSGEELLKAIREAEITSGITHDKQTKIIMTTALYDFETVMNAYSGLCDAYLCKPIRKDRLFEELEKIGLKSKK